MILVKIRRVSAPLKSVFIVFCHCICPLMVPSMLPGALPLPSLPPIFFGFARNEKYTRVQIDEVPTVAEPLPRTTPHPPPKPPLPNSSKRRLSFSKAVDEDEDQIMAEAVLFLCFFLMRLYCVVPVSRIFSSTSEKISTRER